MSELIELLVGLFWAVYLLLQAWLLRQPADDHEYTDPLQGEENAQRQP